MKQGQPTLLLSLEYGEESGGFLFEFFVLLEERTNFFFKTVDFGNDELGEFFESVRKLGQGERG